MKRKLLLFLVLATVANAVAAQNALIEFPGKVTKNSLIRQLKDNIDIIYNYDGTAKFMYVDHNTNMVTEATLPAPIEVTDMEIVGDTLYFCGTMGTTTNFLCFFNIQGFFFGAMSMTVINIPYYVSDTVSGHIYFGTMTLSKIEVQARGLANPGDLHVFMIGDIDFGVPDTVTNFSYLYDVAFDGSGWTLYSAIEPNRNYYFNDITITDNYLWVVGNKYDGRGEYMHGYNLQPTGSSPTLSDPLPPFFFPVTNISYWFTIAPDFYMDSRPRVETLTGDRVAVAFRGTTLTNSDVVIVELYDVGPAVTLVDRKYVPNSTFTSEFRDLKYNPNSNMLFLIPDHTASGSLNMLYGFDLSTNNTHLLSPNFQEIHSVDYRQGGRGAVVSSMNSASVLGEWKAMITHDTCATRTPMSVSNDTEGSRVHEMRLEHDTIGLSPFDVIPSIASFKYKIMCGKW